MRLKEKKKGITVIEIVISLALHVFITVIIFSFLLYSIKTNEKLKNASAGRDEIKFSLYKICSEVRNAKGISVPLSGEGHILVIRSAEINSKGITEDVNIEYYLDSTRKRIYRMVNGTSNLLAENIQDINFMAEGSLLCITITSSRYCNEKYYSAKSAVFPRLKT